MTEDDTLFGDPTPLPTLTASSVESPLADWQVELLRKALDTHGLESMTDRQALVEKLAQRSVPSLRDLRRAEAQSILEVLAQQRSAQQGSSWDEREGETWIDRL